jgi:tRNA A37 threonylcarbamoyladenosine dehydratase
MLVRSGVTHIRLIDFDQVTLSSLNRHAMATMDDVGIPKVEALKRYFLRIVPWCNVEAVPQMFKFVFVPYVILIINL